MADSLARTEQFYPAVYIQSAAAVCPAQKRGVSSPHRIYTLAAGSVVPPMLVPPHKRTTSHLSHPKPGLHLYRNPNNTLCGGGLPSVKTLEPLAMVHTPAATVPIPPTSEDSHEAMQASGRSIHEEHVRYSTDG
ncbi:Zinc-binding domain [Branchiostoma belcheri]|nr:Zinc-binding domain [Branchiostoma belcheri]